MDEPTPDERFERIPWEHLMPDAGPRRRWLGMAAGAVVVVAVGAFLLGSRQPVAPSAAAAPPPSLPAETSTTSAPAPIPLPSEADLRVADAPGVEVALEAHLAEAFSGPGIWVDQVGVESRGDGVHLATISLYEARDGAWVRVEPIGVRIRARSEGGRVVVSTIEPAPVAIVDVPAPAGEVGDVPDPVRDALLAAIADWPDATVERVGSDAGRWWAEVGVAVGGHHLTTVIWPDLDVGLGSGG